LAALRRDVHLVGWLLALEAAVGDGLVEVLGPGRAAIVPGVRAPRDLDLDRGLVARDFQVSDARGRRTAVERFEAVRPSAVANLRPARDLLLVAEAEHSPAAVEAYDHLLTGWWRSVERYRRAGGPPDVVLICADQADALARVRAADAVLTACIAQIGVEPRAWARGGRAGIHFVAEEELHRGRASAWRVPVLPPSLRDGAACEPLRVTIAQLPPGARASAAKPPWR